MSSRLRGTHFSILIAIFLLAGIASQLHLNGQLVLPRAFSSNHLLQVENNNANFHQQEEFSWERLAPSKDLVWVDCFPGRQCARLIVPLNYSNPQGEEAAIAIIRKPSSLDPTTKDYRGPVLFNPGGPGGSGTSLIQGAAADLFSIIIGPQFDIVGFDPRGVRYSTPGVSFFDTPVERAVWGQTFADAANSKDPAIGQARARRHVEGQLAAERNLGHLRHINTDQTARDMLSIVEAHGRTKLQYWGFSYGSVLGATFATMFPDKIERLVIDGVVDSENYYATLWSNNLLDTDKTMDSFYDGCADAGPTNCAFWAPSPSDIRRNLTRLYEFVRTQPIPVKTANYYGIIDYKLLRSAVFSALYSPFAMFPFLAQALADIAAGNPSITIQHLIPPASDCPSDPSKAQLDPYNMDPQVAIMCNDGVDVPGDLKTAQEHFDMMSKRSEWGILWANIRLGCSGWPKFPKDHFQGPFIANTSHPILLVGNTADPVTPLWAAKKMSRGFKDSVVLTQDSAGHCSISGPSPCTQMHIRQYFQDGSLPKPGTVCPIIGTPFPTDGLGSALEEEQALLSTSMTEGERNVFAAVKELSRQSLITLHL